MQPALFAPERHEGLRGGPWSEALARAAVQRIADAACAAYDPLQLWPTHPRDQERDVALPMPTLYHGACGAIWALQRLQANAMARVSVDFTADIDGLGATSRAFNAATGLHPASFLLGEAGVALLQWKLRRDEAAADALFGLAEGNLENPALEQLWGSPGTLLAVVHMLEDLPAGRQARWQSLLRRGADILLAQMHTARHSERPDEAVWIWAQDLYGSRRALLGAGHGLAGNVYPVLRGAPWLPEALVRAFDERAAQTMEVAALRSNDGLVNWGSAFDAAATGQPVNARVQDCHGAPGIICRLAGTGQPALRRLLIDAGELVWKAGPLAKPPGLCHGTDGNGYAFLKLHAMTGESRWLDRARAFAMHALVQSQELAAVHGRLRYTLWTGDLGLALFLSGCVRADPAFPTLDVF